MSAPVVIVGGGPAGHATARAYREAGGDREVLILSDDDRPPYRRPPLTKEHLRGEMAEAELQLEAGGWYAEHDVGLRPGARVVALDPGRRELTTAGGARIVYGDCVLCTGSDPVVPPIPGADGPRVHPVRTARDGVRLRRAARAGARAAVIGAGFIGCEAAASLAMRGLEVTLLAPEPVPQSERLGDGVGELIAGWLRGLGVRLAMETEVASIADDGDLVVATADRGEVRADLAVIGTGARPRVALAEEAGLDVEPGAVPTDAAMRAAPEGLGARATSRSRSTPPPAARCGSSTGARRSTRARSPAGAWPARRPSGRTPRASGRPSAAARSSRSPGATAGTRCGSTAARPASPPATAARACWWASSPTSGTATTSADGLTSSGAPPSPEGDECVQSGPLAGPLGRASGPWPGPPAAGGTAFGGAGALHTPWLGARANWPMPDVPIGRRRIGRSCPSDRASA